MAAPDSLPHLPTDDERAEITRQDAVMATRPAHAGYLEETDQETAVTPAKEFYAPMDGQFSAIVVRVKNSGKPMVKIIGDGPLAGRDGSGIWISAKQNSEIVGPAILKLATSDRVEFTLRGGNIVKLKRSVAAPNAANKTSGRNESAVAAPQPSNGGRQGRIDMLRKQEDRRCAVCRKTFVSARQLDHNRHCITCR